MVERAKRRSTSRRAGGASFAKVGEMRTHGRSLPPHPYLRGEGEDGGSMLMGFAQRIVVSYGLAHIFRGSGEAVLAENDNRRVKREPLAGELKVASCRLQVWDDGRRTTKS